METVRPQEPTPTHANVVVISQGLIAKQVILNKFFLKNKSIFKTQSNHVTGTNPCSAGPCLNGGNCTTNNATSYTCSCPLSFTGKNCSSCNIK